MMERRCFNVALIWIIVLGTCLAQDVTYYLDEEKPNRTFIGNIGQDSNLFNAISDSDSTLVFSVISTGKQYARLFSLDETTSDLFTNTVIDREQVCEFMEVCLLSLQVAAKSPLGSFFRILKMNIYINDRNDHSPVFDKPSLTLPISEAVLVGTSFAIEGARDRDTSPEYSLRSYEIEASDSLEETGVPFTVQFVKHLDGSSTVRLFVTEPLDREKIESYYLEIIAKDGATPPRVGRLPVHIRVTDENDNPPMFASASFNVNITDAFPVYGTIMTLTANDPDFADNGRVGYRFSPHQSADNFKFFEINEITGEITTKEKIVYSPGKQFNVIVEAFDHASEGNILTSQAMVVIRIANEGNTPPQIKISKLSGAEVSEQANVGTVVAYVRIEDHDAGRQGIVSCIIDNTNFKLQPMGIKQYKVIVASGLDYEKKRTQNVTVHCQDDGTPPLRASETFVVTIKDANDHAPFFGKSYFSKNIRENVPIGTVITSVNATDFDTGVNRQVYFRVSEEVGAIFYFDNSTGYPNTAKLRLNRTLDREDKSSYLFPIYAIDKGHPAKTGTATVSLYLTDINDEAPKFTETPFHFSVLENLPSDVLVDNITAIDKDLGSNAKLVYRIHPEDSHNVPFVVLRSGMVKTNRMLDREARDQYTFRVVAIDKGNPPLSSIGNVVVKVKDINDNSPEFDFPRFENSTVYVHYSTMPWQIVGHIVAKDLDEFNNSQLRYSINDRNDTNLFQINPTSGDLQLIQELDSSYLGKTYKLDILASDFGQPVERSTLSPLYITIITSNVTETQTISDAMGGKNFIIIVIIGAVTIVLSLGILITICLIGKIDRQRKKQEAQNKTIELNLDQDTKPFDGSITVFSLPSEDSLINDRRKKEVSFSLEDDVFSDDDLLQQKNCLDSRKNSHFRPTGQLSYLAPSTNNKIEDNHSETSGDTGTSDSGRGGSDDEIHNSFTRSPPPIDQIIDVNSQIQPLSHQEIVPFSFKKGLSMLRDRDPLKEGHSFTPRGSDIELSNLRSDHLHRPYTDHINNSNRDLSNRSPFQQRVSHGTFNGQAAALRNPGENDSVTLGGGHVLTSDILV